MTWQLRAFAALSRDPSLVPIEYKNSSMQAGETGQSLRSLLHDNDLQNPCKKADVVHICNPRTGIQWRQEAPLRLTGQPA